ncbi:MAG: adenylate/guanylate cyclase domain-containing protein [Planctomycetota bacterium]
MATLTLKKNNAVIKEFIITKPRLVLGRGIMGNDLEIPDGLASRQHCEIKKDGDKYVLTDLHSSNGTILNKKNVTTAILKDNDEIQIGMTSIIFKDTGADSSVSSSSVSSDIIKGLNEIPMEYRLNIKEMQDAGQSLAAAPFHVNLEDKKGSKKFFILYQLGKAVSSATTLQEVLDVAMYSIFDSIKAERGVIMLIDKASGQPVPRLSRIRSQKDTKEHITVSHTIINKVINDKVSIISTDAMADSRFSAGMSIAQQNIRSALCVPLWEKQDVFGVVYVDNQVFSHSFTNDDIDLLSAIANQIAIRIKQDELYSNLHKEALLRTNLERYHSPDIVELIISKGGADFAAEEKEISVVFADVQNFTTLSEKLPPADIARMLNEFFETATQIVFEHKGSVNKYIGDAIMAIFGAPVENKDHAVDAARCAMKIIKTLSEQSSTTKLPYNIRIGVNTGVVVAGNIGSRKRIEYTVLGDTVNIASRLNQFGQANQIVIGENTYKAIQPHGIKAKDLGLVQLKGKEKDVRAYQIII